MKNQKGGFIGLIVLIILALIVLKYLYNFSVFEAATTPQGQQTISYTQQLINSIWNVIGPSVSFVANQIFFPLIGIIWGNFQSFLHWGQMNAAAGIH
jgi:hypothetical protein